MNDELWISDYLNMSQPDSQEPSQSQSGSQQSSQYRDKVWSLRGGTMGVNGIAKKRKSDGFVSLELEFSFANESKSRRVGKQAITIKIRISKFIFRLSLQ